MTKDEALELALEALKENVHELIAENKALKEALAQPEQEPVVCDCTNPWAHDQCTEEKGCKIKKKLLRTPPQRTWVGLTDEDQAEILNRKWWNFEDEFDVDGFLRLAEAKLKELNT